jgi:hypothetical protein
MTKAEIYGVDTFEYLLLKEKAIVELDLSLLKEQRTAMSAVFKYADVTIGTEKWLKMEKFVEANLKAEKSKKARLDFLNKELNKIYGEEENGN